MLLTRLLSPLNLITLLLILVTAALPSKAFAGSGEVPLLPVQLSTAATAVPGSTVEYLLHIPNKSAKSYWNVGATINFPSTLRCTRIVSGAGCQLNGSNSLSCFYADIYDWQVKDIRVQCTVDPLAPCASRIDTTAYLTVMKPQAQNNQSTASLTVQCNSTPTPVPLVPTPVSTATPTSTPKPPLDHNLVVPMMGSKGDTVDFSVSFQTPRTISYWGVDLITRFPHGVSCTQIVSQGFANACRLESNQLICHFDDVHPNMGSLITTVRCNINDYAPCNANVSTTSQVTVVMPSQAPSVKSGDTKIKCAPTATPTYVPTNTPTSTPTRPVPTATSTATPSPTATAQVLVACPITPAVNCVGDNGDGTYTAYFGYENNSSQQVTIQAGASDSKGAQNFLSPPPAVRGQPGTFQPGTVIAAFAVKFSGSALTWTVKTHTSISKSVTAQANISKACSPVTPVLACIDKLPGKTKAYFGYTNGNSFEIPAPIGTYNNVAPGALDQGQPTRFIPGTIANAFTTEFAGSTLSWTVFGRSARADSNSNECNPNKPPVCSAGGSPYVSVCSGRQTTIALDGSASRDPEGRPIIYTWTTDCNLATFDDPKKSNPSLTLQTASGGTARDCKVYLKVDDGVATTNCSQQVTVSACTVDCSGAPGGSAKPDICGVCGGDGKSCLGCNGVPNSGAVLDKCGVCAGTNKCLDCNGVPNGSATLDKCGVCNGDGKSCLSCVQTNIKETLLALDNNSQQLKAQVTLATRRLLLASDTKESRAFVERTLAQATTLASEAWTFTWSIPQVITSCTESSACAQTDNSPSINSTEEKNQELYELTVQTMRLVKRARNGKSTQSDRKVSNTADELIQDSKNLSSSIPRFTSSCS